MLTSREKHMRRSMRNRAKLRKTAEGKLRLSVARSGKNISAQVIDDEQGITLASASTLEKDVRKGLKSTSTVEAAAKVGKTV
ncbi:MAG: 50S ribosomal protein L18, partial [Pseudomonadota bacterium]